MSLYPRAPIPSPTRGRSEFEILKASHNPCAYRSRFLREDDDHERARAGTWDEQLAEKYYDSLFREFAVCDLKHYKSGNFSLRWRTESEVLSGAGETTCGNTRCPHHDPRYEEKRARGRLSTLELPFAYEEQGEAKSALVKTVLCEKCLGKMMWKRRKEREKEGLVGAEAGEGAAQADTRTRASGVRDEDEGGRDEPAPDSRHRRRSSRSRSPARRPRRSRSRSPRRRGDRRDDFNRRRSRSREPSRR
ncbi:hypothetical protein MKEN_01308400 [Mycena kentingensis (nom. inval.)]|nr:hypothetical protein MKEN_01308400 [Mycena kentingensis (nom. inval.)]